MSGGEPIQIISVGGAPDYSFTLHEENLDAGK